MYTYNTYMEQVRLERLTAEGDGDVKAATELADVMQVCGRSLMRRRMRVLSRRMLWLHACLARRCDAGMRVQPHS